MLANATIEITPCHGGANRSANALQHAKANKDKAVEGCRGTHQAHDEHRWANHGHAFFAVALAEIAHKREHQRQWNQEGIHVPNAVVRRASQVAPGVIVGGNANHSSDDETHHQHHEGRCEHAPVGEPERSAVTDHCSAR